MVFNQSFFNLITNRTCQYTALYAMRIKKSFQTYKYTRTHTHTKKKKSSKLKALLEINHKAVGNTVSYYYSKTWKKSAKSKPASILILGCLLCMKHVTADTYFAGLFCFLCTLYHFFVVVSVCAGVPV